MEIQNIVATTKTNKGFDLEVLYNKLKNNVPPPSMNDRWLSFRLDGSKRYIAFYKSGKFLITGVKSKKELDSVVAKVIKKLREIGIKNIIEKVEIHNILAMAQVTLKHSLEDIQLSLPTSADVSFEPEQFPGLIYKSDEATFLLFSSGKVICTGCNSADMVKTELKRFKNTIENL